MIKGSKVTLKTFFRNSSSTVAITTKSSYLSVEYVLLYAVIAML